jgi:uncharacterized protein YecE (DUF72 family)
MPRLRIGTSGWTYDGWRGSFYPDDEPKKKWLAWYSTQFNSTEINGSFYRTPSLEAVRAWHDQTPDDFLFAWKASKFITHWKRLTVKCKNSLELMETRLKILGPKLGVVLFQLPAHFKANRERLASFLKMLNKRRRYAFEFRDASWYEPPILKLLEEHNISLCLSDHHDAPAHWRVQRPLSQTDNGKVGHPNQKMASAKTRCLCLFRQRPENRGAKRRSDARRNDDDDSKSEFAKIAVAA